MASTSDLSTIQNAFPRSTVWDSETQQIVDGIRARIYRQPPSTISQIQASSRRPRPIPEGFYVVSDAVPLPQEDDVRKLFSHALQSLGSFSEHRTDITPVLLEWVGIKQAPYDTSSIISSPRETLCQLKRDCRTDTTVFHVHGGNLLFVLAVMLEASLTTLAKVVLPPIGRSPPSLLNSPGHRLCR